MQTSRKTPHRQRDTRAGSNTLWAIPAFLVLYGMVGVWWTPPLWVAGLYLVASLITFVCYAIDKSAAARGAWRTSENSLHLLALLGGWPGALCAQQWLRHKSSKAAFRSVFWVTVALNVTGFVVLCASFN